MDIKKAFPLTGVAMAYLMGRDPRADLGGNATGFYFECEGECGYERLSAALRKVIERQPMLRTVIFPDGTQAELRDIPEYTIPYEDLSGLSESEREEFFRSLRKKQDHEIFPVGQWPMFRVSYYVLSSSRSRVVFSFDMMLVDRFSIELLISELHDFYMDTEVEKEPLSHSYEQYVELLGEQRALNYEKDKLFWEEHIPDMPLAPSIKLAPGDHSSARFDTRVKVLSEEVYGGLQEKLYDNRILPSVYLLYCYGSTLSRFSGSDSLSVSMTVAERSPMGHIFSDVIGDFTKLLLVDIKEQPANDWKEGCRILQKKIRSYLKHTAYDGLDVMKEIARREGFGGKAAFPFAFTSRLTSQDESYWDFLGDIVYRISRTPQLAVDCQISETGGKLEIRWDYLTGVLPEELIDRMFAYFLDTVASLYRGLVPSAGLPCAEAARYNSTEKAIPAETLQSLMERQLMLTPDKDALIAGGTVLTYRSLHEKAAAAASTLYKRYGSGRTIMIDGKRCAETVILILAVLRSGNAYVPFDMGYPEARRKAIEESCRAAAVLTADMLDELISSGDSSFTTVMGSPDDTAYIIFTSGSTGTPKGVVITQDAVCNTIQDINERFGVGEKDCIIGISSFWFDLSVYDLFGALTSGACLLLSEKTDISHIRELMQKYPVTLWNTVPAIMELLTDSGEPFAAHPLRAVLLSGDWIPLELPRKIKAMFPSAEVCSLGGATEGSIWSIYYPVDSVSENWTSIPYGYPLSNQSIYILDGMSRLCPLGVQGEICIGGRGVAKEYCASPDETRAHYFVHPEYGRLYRTGDLGIFTAEGYVEFCGRKDQQVKLHGFRIELGEIESALMKTGCAEKALAAIVKNRSDVPVIGAYITASDSGCPDEGELKELIAESLPSYMMPAFIVRLEEFPLTANGKVDRKALPVPETEASEYEPPATATEKMIAEIWSEVLGISRISRRDSFFYLGGDSLSGLRTADIIRQKTGLQTDISDIFGNPGLCSFCSWLDSCTPVDSSSDIPVIAADPASENEPFPLTDVQRSYWIGAKGMLRMGRVNTHAMCELLCTGTDIDRAEKAFNKVIAEQGMMRAVVSDDGMQRILPDVPFYSFDRYDEGTVTADELRREMEHERFDHGKWPLFRVAVLKEEKGARMFVDLDNMIFDGFSVQLLFRRWNEHYENEQEFRKPTLSFRDYVLAAEKLRGTERYAADRAYWQEKVKSMPPAPELFTKVSPDMLTDQTIMHEGRTVSPDRWLRFREICRRRSVTVSAALFAVYAHMLSLWSRRQTFTINLTQYNRLFSHAEINDLIGDFTLLSMMSVDMGKGESFYGAVKRIQQDMAEDMSHPYYSGVEVQRDYAGSSHNDGVAFPVVFTVTAAMTAGGRDRLFGRVERITTETPQVWLDCQVTELNGGLNISFEAVEELFGRDTVSGMADFCCSLVEYLSDSDGLWDKTVADTAYTYDMIPTLSERKKLSQLPAVGGEETLDSLFIKQAGLTPDNMAVADRERTLTYRQLLAEAYDLSRRIKAADRPVAAILLKKSWKQAVAAMAVLLAGAAYLPLDTGNPNLRISEILKKAGTDLIITEAGLKRRCDSLGAESIVIEPLPLCTEAPEIVSVNKADDLAYIIFTSGSTGQPKGVMIPHRGAVNTILDVNRRFGIGENDRTIAVSALNFDLSVYDLFGMTCCGGAVVIPDENDRRDPKSLAELADRFGVTVWNSVPAFMQLAAENTDLTRDMSSLKVIMLSGDWIPLSLPEKLMAALPDAEIYSLGGATEASVWSNYYHITSVEKGWRSIPYGYPLSGQGFRVLNSNMTDCPPMTVGKLYISGTGLAMGYLNDEELTAQRFITDSRSGERLYDTGDLGMYWEDGTIEFFGREDHQVKIRGHRIELGEIDAALMSAGTVSEVCTFTVSVKGRTHIAAAAVAADGGAVFVETLRKAAESRLPSYMIPDMIFGLEALPLTANAKTDRKALAAMAEELIQEQHSEAADTGLTEKELIVAGIWRSVLNTDEMPSAGEDFFDFGGDSLDIVRVRNALSESVGREIEIGDIFEDVSVSGMARLI
ncbi:non-ribosomal peptide synthetase [Ruminococcus sp.]|uniref:non-ribosomal peptide synthetase n=1 Tax=Ruminococcus sp. TaxID=41978 RepID=UPI002BEAC5B4|nr:non-ribosomal peptide synthetase [Ruminococcus sp.]HNZ99585.1 amino acid adenylation domain-containing protein [Ruminococcus sp.]